MPLPSFRVVHGWGFTSVVVAISCVLSHSAPPCRVSFVLPQILFLEAGRGPHEVRPRAAMSGSNGDDPDAIGIAMGWPTPTYKGTGLGPQRGRGRFQGVLKRQREMHSLYGRTRRPCCAQYAHRLNADTHCVRLTCIGQCRLCFEMAFTSRSLSTVSCSPDGAMRLTIFVVFPVRGR